VMAAVGCCDCVDRTDRRALGRSRGFHRAHDRLRDLQDLRRRRDEMGSTTAVFPFHDERDCERYLADRFRAAQQPCPHCGARRGAYLPSRRAWECGECHRQTGLRGGTVMARSGLPLLTWFRAIAAVLARPTIATAELAEELGIRRKATVRQLARRIREALLADDASERLAGLDNYLCADSEPPEPGVHRNKKAPTMLAHRPSRRRSIEPPHNSQNTAIDAQDTPASST